MQLSDEQALFIATLPEVFCTIDDAIRTHAFVNRVAAISIQDARNAIGIGLAANWVDVDDDGKFRLTLLWCRERDSLEKDEGIFEVAVGELARLIILKSKWHNSA